MRRLLSINFLLACAVLALSCHEEIKKPDNPEQLVVGKWNSYETGSTKTGFTPGRETLLTIIYASGLSFSADHTFAMRFYDNAWHNGDIIGTYKFLTEKTIELTFSPGTTDESKFELQIDKLNNDVFWFRHDFWVNDQNPDLTENHLQRVE